MTAYLLSELTKNKVKVIFCDEKRNPSSELLPCYGSHDTSLKLRNQIKWDEIRKKEVWTQIVKEKILQQAALLQSLSKEEYRMLVSYAEEMEFGVKPIGRDMLRRFILMPCSENNLQEQRSVL